MKGGEKMKRLIVLGIVLVLCLPVIVYSATIGGAETQGKGETAVGFDQEFVFDRNLKNTKSTDENINFGKVEVDQIYRSMAKISYGLLDNLDVYVKLGTADAKIKSPATYGPQYGIYGAKTSNAFVWGLGIKGTYEFAAWLLGTDIQYLRHRHSTNFSFNDSDWDGKLLFQEWQVAPYLAKRLGNFIPYLGVKYSDLRVTHKDEDDTIKFKADDNFGVFVGSGYKINDRLSLNGEVRFVDETAISFGCTYKF